MIDMSLAKLYLASYEMRKTFSRQLNAMSMISLLRSRCCDFSFVKITMNDFMIVSRSSLRLSSAFSIVKFLARETLPCGSTLKKAFLPPNIRMVGETGGASLNVV